MKKNYYGKKLLALILIFLAFGSETALTQVVAKSKANKDTEQFRYDIECAGNGTYGTYLVKIWSYSKKVNVAESQSRKNAVHGVIFKGFSGGQDCVGQRPLVKNPGVEMENQTYFESFFADGGEFQKYASVVNHTMETVKVGKEYKVGVIVSVQKDELRKALEAAGIIKALNAGF